MDKIIAEFTSNIQDYLRYNKEINAIDDLVVNMFETILKCERDLFLQEKQPFNKGNGFYERSAKALSKYFTINVPRDRLGLFKPVFLDILKQQNQNMCDLAYKLYVKGLTTRDIEEVFSDVFNKKMSRSQVSSLSANFAEERDAFLSRSLEESYYFVYIDASYIPVRRGGVSKEAFYVAIGVRSDFKREILGIYNIPTESASGWQEVIKDLKSRGLKQVLMFVADGLTGLENVIKKEFKNTDLQKCLVHKIRHLLIHIKPCHKAEITADFQRVFRLEDYDYNIKKAEQELDLFLIKWQRFYPKIKTYFKKEHYEHYFAYLKYPPSIQRMIYTTNWIERLNKTIKKSTKIRNSFPNPKSALNLITAVLMDFEERVYKYPISSFLKAEEFLKFKLETQFS